jgi:hypothetical protein
VTTPTGATNPTGISSQTKAAASLPAGNTQTTAVNGPGSATTTTTLAANPTTTPASTAAAPAVGGALSPWLLVGGYANPYGFRGHRPWWGYGGYGYGGYGRRFYGYGANNSQYFVRMRRLARLISALNSLTPGAAVTPMHTNRLNGGLMGVAYGGVRPPFPMVQQLSSDLASVLPRRNVPMMNTSQLARDLEVVMNGSRNNGMQIQYAIGSAQGIMNGSGVNRQGIMTVSSDMQKVALWGHMGNPLAQLR